MRAQTSRSAKRQAPDACWLRWRRRAHNNPQALTALTTGNWRNPMARDRSELEQRREELTRSLPGLSDNRANTYRRNSDALALDRSGVKHQEPEERAQLGEAETAADAAIRDAQREIRDIDAQIAVMPRRGLAARVLSGLRRAPADR